MANETDDEKLQPLGDNSQKFLEESKKGKPRSFLLICKGTKVTYLAVGKRPVKDTEVQAAKKRGYKGEPCFGVITGKGMDLVFNLPKAEYESEPVKDRVLKDFLDEHAGLKAKPTFRLVDQLPDLPLDDEDSSHPLIEKFMKLELAISHTVAKRPDTDGELTERKVKIRELIDNALFDAAAPQVEELIARLKELAQVPKQVQPSAPSISTQDNDIGSRLLEALNKLNPQVKQAVTIHPDRKGELLGPIKQIEQQIEQQQYDAAKQGILAVRKALQEMVATTTPSPRTETADELLAAMKALSPVIKQIVADHPEREEELLRPVAAFQSHIKANQLLEAKDLLVHVSDLVKAIDHDVSEMPEVSLVILQQARLAWEKTREVLRREVQKLEQSILDACIDDPDVGADTVDVTKLQVVLDTLDSRLIDELDEALNASDVEKRREYNKIAHRTVQEYLAFVETNPLMADIDESGFASVAVKKTASNALKLLARKL